MAAYLLAGRAARRARRTLLIVLVVALALSDVVLLAPPQGAQASRSEQTGGTAYQVTLKVGSGLVYSLPQGASVTLPISVSVTAAVGLASASVLVQYNPLQLRPTACDPREGPSGGFCNISYDTENGLIRFNVLSDTGLLGSDVGLFDLTFAAAATSTVRTQVPVTPLIESITDLHGNYMTSWAQGSTVKIAAPSGGAAVYVGAPNAPNPLSITRGQTITVPTIVTGLTGLGAASFSLAFDPAVVRPLACRSVQHPDASGVCALHDDHVAANLISQDGMPGSATESVTAFEVDFTTAPTALVDAKSPLNLTLGAFADTAGAAIPVRLINNTLKVAKAAGEVVPILRLEPVAQNLNDDARVTVQVLLDNGAALAAGSWGIRYDPLVVQAESCQTGPNVTNAVCNPAAEPGLVRMTVLGLTEDGLPADLPANIGSITFRRHPEAKAKQKSSLTFEVTNFTDDLDQHLPFQTKAAEITIAHGLGSPAAVAIRLIGTPPYQLYRGSSLDFPVNFTTSDSDRLIANLTGSIHYDPIVLRPTRCVLNSPTAEGPTAFCNAQYDTAQGIIRFTLFDADGFSGSVTPFVLTFEAASTAVAENTSPLRFSIEAIGGPLGEPRTWAATDEKVTIKGPVTAPRVLVGSPDLLNTETYTVTLGSTATVPLWVENVSNLGAGTIEVRYDPTVARATRCTLRSDLTPALDGGFCSLLPGAVRFAFVASQGITGSSQLYDIEFAQAPNVVAGNKTPLNVVVLNFVDIYENPIPTTVRGGIIVIGAIRVTKTADPTHVPETGGNVTFTFLVENIGQVGVTLNRLVDTRFGNLAGKGTCTVPQKIQSGGSYSCKYVVHLSSDSLTAHTNVVTARATDSAGVLTTDDDDATVTFDDVAPAIRITKTASPTHVPDTGGNVTFTFLVENIGQEDVTLNRLVDTKFGNLAGKGTCAVPQTILIGGSYSCTYTVSLASASLAPHTNMVTAAAVDDDGSEATDNDDETVTFDHVSSLIGVTKTADPTAVPETGGSVKFTYTLTNRSTQPITITAHSDDKFGTLAGDADCMVGTVLASGASCAFEATFAIPAGDYPGSHTDTFTATVEDINGSIDSATDDETVTYTDVKPDITATKTAQNAPASVPETGGNVTFTYEVQNNSAEVAEITILRDDKFGPLAGDADCHVGTVLAGGASCAFDATFLVPTGNYGGSHTNTFTATVADGDGNNDTATDSETVIYTDVKPTITVAKTANPISLPEPGGNVEFTVVVTNNSFEPVTLTSLTDNVYGGLNGKGACATGGTIAAGASYTCHFTGAVSGEPGTHTDTVTAVATDNDGSTDTKTATATVRLTDVKPTITVTKTANPTSLPEPGGNVEFTVVVTDNSFEPVTLTSLIDNVYGGLSGKGACATGGTIAAGASYTCHFIGAVSGEPGAYTDTVTAVATDNDGSTDTKTATATVTLTDVKPTITVTKTGSPTTVPETSSNVTFTYVVKNNSVKAARITALSDDKFGTLTGGTNCQVDTVLTGGASCAFEATFLVPAGNYGGSHTNVFSATVTDGDGNYATATEPETVTYTDVKPDITVLKTGVPTSVPKTGGNVTFTYRVTNRSTEAATITVLTDNKFGTLAGNAACKVGTVLAAGAYCQFSATFAVPAGTYPGSHTNIFSATVTDGDGNYATATEPETITYTPPNTPGGKILPTGTTCQQYRDGSAGTMNRVQYTLKGTKISTVSPGAFFYYSTIQLTTGQFAITVPQRNAYKGSLSPTDVWPDIPAQNTDGIILWNAACNKVPATTASYDPVSNTATISGSAAPDIYYLSVKYNPSARYVQSTNSGLVGYTLPAVPARPSVTYTFKTVLKEGGGAPADVSGSAAAIDVIWKK